jgi:hypothetical protein
MLDDAHAQVLVAFNIWNVTIGKRPAWPAAERGGPIP